MNPPRPARAHHEQIVGGRLVEQHARGSAANDDRLDAQILEVASHRGQGVVDQRMGPALVRLQHLDVVDRRVPADRR